MRQRPAPPGEARGVDVGDRKQLGDDADRQGRGEVGGEVERPLRGGVVEQARKDGYTETILGRRRYLPDLTTDNRQRREMAERMALNAPIQGSAADIIKVAMLNVHRALQAQGLRSRMLLQVHDELVLEIAGRTPERPIVPVASKEPRVNCMIGEKIWQDRWGR